MSHAAAWLMTKAGVAEAYCNSCESEVARFYDYGGRPWGCPLCSSTTRERFIINLIDNGSLSLSTVQSVLHVAPSELGIIDRLRRISDYHPVDLFPQLYKGAKTQRMDLMELNDAGRYDVVYLSHVMEHVPDDMVVFTNLFNSLKSGGQAWVLVPLWDRPTVHGGNDMTPREREKNFGQWDHVRQYGPDIADRMSSAGFRVETIKAEESDPSDFSRLGLHANDWVFCGTKA